MVSFPTRCGTWIAGCLFVLSALVPVQGQPARGDNPPPAQSTPIEADFFFTAESKGVDEIRARLSTLATQFPINVREHDFGDLATFKALREREANERVTRYGDTELFIGLRTLVGSIEIVRYLDDCLAGKEVPGQIRPAPTPSSPPAVPPPSAAPPDTSASTRSPVTPVPSTEPAPASDNGLPRVVSTSKQFRNEAVMQAPPPDGDEPRTFFDRVIVPYRLAWAVVAVVVISLLGIALTRRRSGATGGRK